MAYKQNTRDLNYIDYWHRSLIDASQIQLEKKSRYIVPRTQILEGLISDLTIIDRLKAEVATKNKHAVTDSNKNDDDLIRIIVSYATVTPSRLHGEITTNTKNAISLINLPTLLCPTSGRLEPDPDSSLFIDRNILEPLGSAGESDDNSSKLVVGNIDDVDTFLEQHHDDKITDWASYISFASCLYAHITHTSNDAENITVDIEGHVLSPYATIVYNDAVDGVIFRLSQFYNSLKSDAKRKKNALGPLLTTLINPPTNPKRHDSIEHAALSILHTGSMTNQFPNTEGQRIAIHHTLAGKAGDMIAVNGPPGTGKTTLLQGVVASYWVNAALTKNGRPPLIVASSTNNQAVTNIIESFTSALSDPTLYWRSKPLQSLGLYLCSDSKAAGLAGTKTLYASKLKKGQKSKLNNEQYLGIKGSFDQTIQIKENIEKETKLLLERSGASSLKDVIKILHATLTKQHSEYIALINTVKDSLSALNLNLDVTIDELIKNHSHFIDSRATHEQSIETLNLTINSFQQQVAIMPFWMSLLSFIPFVKKQARYFLSLAFNRVTNLSGSEKQYFTGDNFKNLDNHDNVMMLLSERVKDVKKRIQTIDQQLKWIDNLNTLFPDNDSTTSILDIMNKKCDCELRYDMFTTALRYWTARFLDEAGSLPTYAEKSREVWSRYTMMTPCFVSTLHSLPGFFGNGSSWGKGETTDVIDLLIIDEAGQVSPEVGVPAFAMAKKALVVGDTKQIEPVWGVNALSDRGNFSHANLRDYEQHTHKGVLASNGSVMKMALTACHLKTPIGQEYTPGLMLTEHYRCQKKIISYCNELAYVGALEPRTKEVDLIHPKMAYLHCDSPSTSKNGSRINQKAAELAIQWITDNSEFIINEYGSKETPSVLSLVAIVTPFKAMAQQVIEVANSKGIVTGKEGMTVGTVHSLQGAEREIIIFLPTYGGDKDASMSFINNGVNLLNVAVSRAKKHFIVIGDIELFKNGEKGRPSTLLYDYLEPWNTEDKLETSTIN